MSATRAIRRPASPTGRVARAIRAFVACGTIAFAMRPVPAPAATVLPDGFADTLVTPGLSQPASMAWLPDGRLLIIEQKTSNLRLVVNDVLAPPVFTVPEVNGDGLERGLLGIAVDPAFPARPYLYFYLSHLGIPAANHIVRYALTGDLADATSANLHVDPASAFPVLTDIPDQASNHNAGSLRFGPEGLLYVSVGDDAGNCVAQDPSLLRGVLLRLSVSQLPDAGSGPPAKSVLVPPGNPLAGPNDNARLTIAHGLRNPFRISIDPVSGRVLIGDVGQSAWEEVDVLDPDAFGQNFGWPLREGPAGFITCPGIPSDPSAFREPVAFYDRANVNPASVIAASMYRGAHHPFDRSFPPEYEGDAFFAEYYHGFLRRLRRATDGTWGPAAPVPGQPSDTDWARGLSTPADFGVGPDGALYYLSQFGEGGSLHRIAFQPPLTLKADDARGEPGATGVTVAVRSSAPLTLGSTDVRLRFDPTVLRATAVTSDLEGFTFAVDDAAGTLTTASASAAGQSVAAASPLFTVAFDVHPAATGCSPILVEDADDLPPDDLTSPAPPIPPAAIPHSVLAGSFCASRCGNGVAEAGEDCDDGNLANGDCCDASCQFELAGTSCAETLCTVGRVCDGRGAGAGGTARSCDDTNPCTDDTCDAGTGCLHAPNTAPCDDGNACTTPDACAGGVCIAGPARVCDDGNPCTTDGCAPGGGCTTAPAPDGATCDDDGNLCTFDRCIAGSCTHPSAVDCAGLGDVDCDGRGATPIDAQVMGCLEVGRCTAADVPSPCDDPTVRRMRGDWDLAGELDAADRSTTLDLFVGKRQLADTPLGACCAAVLLSTAK